MFCPSCVTAEALPIIHTDNRRRGDVAEEYISVPRCVIWTFGVALGITILFGIAAAMRK